MASVRAPPRVLAPLHAPAAAPEKAALAAPHGARPSPRAAYPFPRAQYAFIMRVSEPPLEGEAFAKVQLEGCTDVADVAARACEKFEWGVPTRARLFLAAAGGEDAPPPAALAEAAADPARYLGVGWTLARAGIVPGCWLLARVPAEAPAGAHLCLFPPPSSKPPPSPRPPHTHLNAPSPFHHVLRPTQRNATQAQAAALALRLRS